MLIAVNFHYIRETFSAAFPGIHGVLPDEFEHQLEILGTMGSFVSYQDIQDALAERRALPDRAIVITFDDGLREQYDLAWPILKRKGIPAIFFVNTAAIADLQPSLVHQIHYVRAHTEPQVLQAAVDEYFRAHGIPLPVDIDAAAAAQYRYDLPEIRRVKYQINMLLTDAQQAELIAGCMDVPTQAFARSYYMTPEQTREMAQAGVIGAHSHEHVPLARLSEDQLLRQFRLSQDAFDRMGVTDIRAFSYPYGSPSACSERVAAEAQAHGFSFAFTMERAANHTLDCPMFLARYAQNDVPGGNSDIFGARDFFETAPAATWFR